MKSDLSTISGHSVSADTTLNPYSISTSNTGQLITLLANVRGLRQSDLSTISGHSVSADTTLNPYSISTSNTDQLITLLANVRGLRQAAVELSKFANEFKPHLIGFVETHLMLGLWPWAFLA